MLRVKEGFFMGEVNGAISGIHGMCVFYIYILVLYIVIYLRRGTKASP